MKREPISVCEATIPRKAYMRDSENRISVPTRAMVKAGLKGFPAELLPVPVPLFRRTFWRLTPQKMVREIRITIEVIKRARFVKGRRVLCVLLG